MTTQPHEILICLPPWLHAHAAQYRPTTRVGEQMDFVIAAARRNALEQTGGPFAAAVFETHSGALVSLGVNLVISEGLSVLHAEIVALSLAQRLRQNPDLGSAGLPRHRLVSSVEPCAMCLGAIPWSGIAELVTGARDADARAIGFDEGQKPGDWQAGLQERGIEVTIDVQRDAAREVLSLYHRQDGPIYGPTDN